MTVDFATYCCEKDKDKLHANFLDHVQSHNYTFDQIHLIYQRVSLPDNGLSSKDSINNRLSFWGDLNVNSYQIKEKDYHSILKDGGIKSKNKEADKYTHGWNGPHYWKHHCVNHLTAMRESTADYLVFSDADCHIKSQPVGVSWVEKAILALKRDPSILLVSPSDGGGRERKTQNMSQQIFLADRKRLKAIDFDLPFTGFRDGGPFAEYYFMLEGRIGRYMEKHELFRLILDDRYRYWHKGWH